MSEELPHAWLIVDGRHVEPADDIVRAIEKAYVRSCFLRVLKMRYLGPLLQRMGVPYTPDERLYSMSVLDDHWRTYDELHPGARQERQNAALGPSLAPWPWRGPSSVRR